MPRSGPGDASRVKRLRRFHSWSLSFTQDSLAFSTKTARRVLQVQLVGISNRDKRRHFSLKLFRLESKTVSQKYTRLRQLTTVHTAETAQTHVSLDSYHGVHTPPAVSVRNRWRQQRRGWSPVPATGSLHSARDISVQASPGAALDEECRRSGKTLIASLVLAQKEWLQAHWVGLSRTLQLARKMAKMQFCDG